MLRNKILYLLFGFLRYKRLGAVWNSFDSSQGSKSNIPDLSELPSQAQLLLIRQGGQAPLSKRIFYFTRTILFTSVKPAA